MQYVSKKIDSNHIVWFEQANRWVEFEAPAWFVNKLYQKGVDIHTISYKCAKKYDLSKDECFQFVHDICKSIDEMSKPDFASCVNSNTPYLTTNYSFVPYVVRYYQILEKRFVIIYESCLAEYYIHQPLAHLEIEHSDIADAQFEIFSFANIPVLREKDHPETASVFEDFNQLKKRLFINILNIIYNKKSSDWLSFVHASALTNGKHTLLLSSASGSGKSTMAALLQAKGLQLVSDDFVPVDAKTKQAFPFPAAVSVKNGAFSVLSPYYGNLYDKNFNKYENT